MSECSHSLFPLTVLMLKYMNMQVQLPSTTRSRTIVITASTLALIVSGLVLCGWMLDVELFKRLFPQLVTMNPSFEN
jgi:hypothetical protein